MIGNRIKKLREELGLKQDELAKKIGISPSAVGMYERDLREANDEIKLKMCDLFNCSMDFLTGKSEIRNPEELKKIPFANAGGLNVNGLDEEDLLELQKQIDYIKKLKEKK